MIPSMPSLRQNTLAPRWMVNMRMETLHAKTETKNSVLSIPCVRKSWDTLLEPRCVTILPIGT